MFELFLTFVFILIVSFSRVSALGNKTVALKNQLAKSLIHVSEMLVDIEDKIGQERKVLSQIYNDLNRKKLSAVGRMDYDINIWWKLPNATTATPALPYDGKYGNITLTIITTSSLMPRPPPTSTIPTPPENWHVPTIVGATKSPFIEDMKQNMALDHHGYFSAFVTRLSELVYTRNETVTYPVVYALSLLIKHNIQEGIFKNMDQSLTSGVGLMLTWFDSFTTERIKQQAGVLHHLMKVKDKAFSTNLKSAYDFYDKMFTEEEGERLFEALELFYIYPEGNITAITVAGEIFRAAFAPYVKAEGKRKQTRLIQYVYMAIRDFDRYFRAEMSSLEEMVTGIATTDHNLSALPERRKMNNKKVVKHFFKEHPKLFRKIKIQYEHDKRKKHYLSHKQKRNDYRKSRGGYPSRGNSNVRERTRHRDQKDSSNEPEVGDTDSAKSGAYFHKHSGRYQQKNVQRETSEEGLDNLDQYRLSQLTSQPREWIQLKKTKATTKPYQENPQNEYVKQLAINLLRHKQQSQNFYGNRRKVPSVEGDICNHTQYFQNSVENKNLRRIRETSSYSDEEDHLRNNLYDALRHGNRTFVSFRKSNGNINKKQTLWPVSSETDEEWVFKNNIYKVFEHVN